MEKLVYLKSWRETEKANVVCVHKSNKEELEQLFEDYKYKIEIVDFNDDKSVALLNHDYSVSASKFWFNVFNVLLDNNYKFTNAVQSRFEWYKSKIEFSKQEPILVVEKEQVKTILWCWENGCETTLTACKKCRFTKNDIECQPQRAVIEERDGKTYVRILRRDYELRTNIKSK